MMSAGLHGSGLATGDRVPARDVQTETEIVRHSDGTQTHRVRLADARKHKREPEQQTQFVPLGKILPPPAVIVDERAQVAEDLRQRVLSVVVCGGVPIAARTVAQSVGASERDVAAALESLEADREVHQEPGGWRGPRDEAENIARARARAARGFHSEQPIDRILASIGYEPQTARDIAERAGVDEILAIDILRMLTARGVVSHPPARYVARARGGSWDLGWMFADAAGSACSGGD